MSEHFIVLHIFITQIYALYSNIKPILAILLLIWKKLYRYKCV